MAKKQSSTEMDEIWQLFGQECKECLDTVEDSLLELETNPTNSDLITVLFRAIHTYKGNVRMMGLSVLESLAHRAEDLASLIRENKITPDPSVTDVLLKVTDRLRQLLAEVISRRGDVEKNQIEEVMLILDTFIKNQSEQDKPARAEAQVQVQPVTETALDTEKAESLEMQNEIPSPQLAEVGKDEFQTEKAGEAESGFIPTTVLTHDVEQVDPATDPQYLRIFLDMAHEELAKIHLALDVLAGGNLESATKLIASSDCLKYAADCMCFTKLSSILEEMMRTIQLIQNEPGLPHTENIAHLKEQVFTIEQFIDAKDGTIPEADSSTQHQTSKDTSEKVRQWLVDKTQSQIATDALVSLKQNLGEVLADYTILHQTIERLHASDMEEEIQHILTRQEEKDRMDLEARLQTWSEDLQTLRQTDRKMSSALQQIQEQVRDLGLRPVTEIIQPLESLLQEQLNLEGKKASLKISGESIRLDGSIIQSMEKSLNDLVKFSIKYSIEIPSQRLSVGKPEIATIKVAFSQHEDHTVLVVEDDGAGLDFEAIQNRAHRLGWIDGDSTPEELMRFLLRSGFGKVGSKDDGLDFSALSEHLKASRGSIHINSQAGAGICSTIRIPIEMAVIDSLAVRIDHIHYVLPISAVRRIVWLEQEKLEHSSAEGDETFIHFEDKIIPVKFLHPGRNGKDASALLIIVLDDGEGNLRALVVDELLGQQQAIVYPLQGILANIKYSTGCALLGNGEIGFILSFDSAWSA